MSSSSSAASYTDQDQTTLSVPSLIAFAIISFFTIRYFFFSPSGLSSSTTPSSSVGGRQAVQGGDARTGPNARRRYATREKVETVAAMFPQLSRRDIEYDLERNGGSVQASTERVLREGRLPLPPPNFLASEASQPISSPTSSVRSPSTTGSSSSSSKSANHSDLITRYNLASRVNAAQPTSEAVGPETDTIQSKSKQLAKGSWSTNKADRAELLKKRRDEMILSARKKMEEKDRKGKERE